MKNKKQVKRLTREELNAQGLMTFEEVKQYFSDLIDFSIDGSEKAFEECLNAFCKENGFKVHNVMLLNESQDVLK